MKEQTTLITGCTSGIGLYLAREFAKNGHDLILVAPAQEELQVIASELQGAYGTRSLVIASDLERRDSPLEIFETLERKGVHVDVLVNNAGQGFRGKFAETPGENDEAMVNLNIQAVLRLTKHFLPPMISQGQGRILNTASVAGFEPGPLLAVYHATKAFVLSWTEALAVELENTGVTVTALCPGATDTDFFPKAGMVDAVAFQKGNLMAPQDVAKAAYHGLMKGTLLVVPGASNKILIAARRVLSEEMQAKLNARQYESVPIEKRSRKRGDVEHKAHQ